MSFTMPSPSSFRFARSSLSRGQAFRRFAQHFGHDFLADLQDFAIAVRPNRGRARFTGQQRHFAETIALAHHRRARIPRAILAHRNMHAVPRSMTNIESPSIAFLGSGVRPGRNDGSARCCSKLLQLRFVQAIEKRFASQDGPRFGLSFGTVAAFGCAGRAASGSGMES